MLVRRVLGQAHLWLSLLVGAQVLVWIATGLFFTLNLIETVRGDHLRDRTSVETIDWRGVAVAPEVAAAAVGGGATDMRLSEIAGRPVWTVQSADGRRAMVDARTGAVSRTLSEADARTIAAGVWKGRGVAGKATFFLKPPKEAGGENPVWRVDFTGPDRASIHVDAATGQVRNVRTPLWRVYDFLWGLHIMDWRERENFHHPILWAFAVGGLALALAGAGLSVSRVRQMLGRRRARRPVGR
jgi:uncharacterized membrane protein YkoI